MKTCHRRGCDRPRATDRRHCGPFCAWLERQQDAVRRRSMKDLSDSDMATINRQQDLLDQIEALYVEYFATRV